MFVLIFPDPPGTPGSAAPLLVVPDTVSPASQFGDVVPSTPAPARPASAQFGGDPVLTQIIKANEAGLRKRRLAQGVSPEIQVQEPAFKFRLESVKSNLSQLF